MSLGNDELIAAQLAHLPGLTFVAMFAIPFGTLVYVIVKDFGRGLLRRAACVGLLMAITLAIGIFVDNVLDPWLFASGRP